MKKSHIQHSRRDFLKIAGVSAIGTGLAPELVAEAQNNEPVTATVSIVKNASVKHAVRDAVEMSGGLDFIKPGQRVLIKPNQVAPVKRPITTNAEVLYEVVKLVAEAGCDNIFVSDQGFHTFKKGSVLMKASGHYDAAKQAESDVGGGVKVIPVAFADSEPYLKPGSPIWREIHHPLAKRWVDADGKSVGFKLAELLFQVDHIINVPACKCHTQLWFTLSMKAFVGMTAHPSRFYFHAKSESGCFYKPGDNQPWTNTEADVTPPAQYIAELNLGVAPALNIIDGTRPLYAGSHVRGESAKADIIIASRDRIAADVTGVALLRTVGAEKRLYSMSPWKHPLIRHARKLRLGVKRRSDLTVKHKGVDTIDTMLEHMA
jgi:uncharacterized protein (DUF362 family)